MLTLPFRPLQYEVPRNLQPVRTPSSKGIAMRLFSALFFSVLALTAHAQQGSPDQTEFAVMRTDRVVVTAGDSTQLNCSVIGLTLT